MLTVWQFFPLPLADKNESYTPPTISSHVSVPDKPPKKPPVLYKGVMITKEGLTEALEYDMLNKGLSDKLDIAEYIIQHESGWHWYAQNAISFGLFAFTKDTWNGNCIGDIWNPYAQIDCATDLMAKKQWGRWDTFCTSKYNTNNDWRCASRGLFKK